LRPLHCVGWKTCIRQTNDRFPMPIRRPYRELDDTRMTLAGRFATIATDRARPSADRSSTALSEFNGHPCHRVQREVIGHACHSMHNDPNGSVEPVCPWQSATSRVSRMASRLIGFLADGRAGQARAARDCRRLFSPVRFRSLPLSAPQKTRERPAALAGAKSGAAVRSAAPARSRIPPLETAACSWINYREVGPAPSPNPKGIP
jgi:hypothetical protein